MTDETKLTGTDDPAALPSGRASPLGSRKGQEGEPGQARLAAIRARWSNAADCRGESICEQACLDVAWLVALVEQLLDVATSKGQAEVERLAAELETDRARRAEREARQPSVKLLRQIERALDGLTRAVWFDTNKIPVEVRAALDNARIALVESVVYVSEVERLERESRLLRQRLACLQAEPSGSSLASQPKGAAQGRTEWTTPCSPT